MFRFESAQRVVVSLAATIVFGALMMSAALPLTPIA